jgi:hypothetical protein
VCWSCSPSASTRSGSWPRRAGVVDSRRVKNTVVCALRDPQTAELLAVARRMLTANLRHDASLLAQLDTADDAVALADTTRSRA